MAHQLQVTLIHNPDAGEGKPSAGDLEEILKGAGFQVRYVSSKDDWKKALDKPSDIIVAAGGDGTVAKVARRLANTERTLALLPLGTANNVARTLRVLGDARALAATWRLAAPRPIDLGRLKLDGEDEGELFIESVGGGIFAESIKRGREASEPSSIVGPPSDRAILLLREIVSAARPLRWEIEVDGEDHSGEYLAVEAMNIRFVGPNVPLAPEADPGDGWLDLVLVGEEQRKALLEHLTARVEQVAAPLPATRIVRGRHIRLRAAQPKTRLHRDDELLETTTSALEIELERGAVELVGADPQVVRHP